MQGKSIRANVIAAAVEHDAAAQNEELTVILNSLYMAADNLYPGTHPASRWVMEAAEATLRLALITRRMQHYSERFRLDKRSASAGK